MESMRFPDSRLIVFAKAPIVGQVKTRLRAEYNDNYISELHAALVTHTLHMACQSNLAPVELWCTPDFNHPFFSQCAATFPIELLVQDGADLGQRMSNAFTNVLTRAQQAVIIGTDCPMLTPNYLSRAFTILSESNSAVIGPASDGGYTLLGLHAADVTETLFSDMPWGTDQVLSSTLDRLKQTGMKYRLLHYLPDIDLPIDLQIYLEKSQTLDLHPLLRRQLEKAEKCKRQLMTCAESA